MPYKKLDIDEDGSEFLIDLKESKDTSDDYSEQESFKEVYSKKSGTEFICLKLQNGTVYHAGEKIKGIVEFKSDTNQKPTIIIKGIKMISFETNNTYYSKVKYLNTKIICEYSPSAFQVPIPLNVPYGNIEIATSSESEVRVEVKYQISIKMTARKRMSNLFGLINFSTTIPMRIYPKPLYEKLKLISDFNYTDKDIKSKLYNFSLRFPTNTYEVGSKQKIKIKWRNPQEKYEKPILQFHIFLRSSICVFIEAGRKRKNDDIPKSKDYVMVGKKKVTLGEKLLGIVNNNHFEKQYAEETVVLPIPEGICPNEEIADDFLMEYSIKCVATLYDYQIKGPTLEHNIFISSPVPEPKRLELINYKGDEKYEIISEKFFEKIDHLQSVISGINL
eukprot:gene7833-12307_t